MWHELHSGLRVGDHPARYATFSLPLITKLLRHRQFAPKAPETGGILLGSIRGGDFDVRFMTTPLPLDVQSRFRYERRDPSHIQISKRLSAASQSRITYLGEWHTHPTPNPVPSDLDRTEWVQAHRALKGPFLALILGTVDFYIEALG